MNNAQQIERLANGCKMDAPTAWMCSTAKAIGDSGRGEILALATGEWTETDQIGRDDLESHGLVDVRGRITAKGRILARALCKWRYSESARANNPWRQA